MFLSSYNEEKKIVGLKMDNEPLKIKKRGDDGTRLITVRIKEDTLAQLDRLSAETNHSRNELINLILSHGIKNIVVEE